MPERDIHIMTGIEDVRRPYEGGFLYPLVTAPLTGKILAESACPGTLLGSAQEFLSDCHKFLVAGTSGLDSDLFEVLNSGIKEGSPNPVVRVVESGSKASTFDNFQRGVVAFRNRLDPGASKFNDGFYEYVFGKGLDAFVSAA